LVKSLGSKIYCEFEKSDVLSISSDEKYDLIFLEETLHHLEPRRRQIAKIKELLSEDGLIVISEVNAYNLPMQVALLKKRGLKTVEKRVKSNGSEYIYGIERIVPARIVKNLFVDGNLRMVSLRYLRIFSSKIAGLLESGGIDLMAIEKTLLRCSLFSRMVSIHYNIVFIKTGSYQGTIA